MAREFVYRFVFDDDVDFVAFASTTSSQRSKFFRRRRVEKKFHDDDTKNFRQRDRTRLLCSL